ncbi:hypothetical protein ABZ845_21705 [Streptomyces sp. NPDC047022]|uniref:hypothetical protein n=1 Tax=Streptomyces sp. NPDC047022 TaxID=3155737 RepID=UPI0033DFF54A
MSFKKIATTAALAIALGAAIPTAPAFAINETNCGKDRLDFLRLEENHQLYHCYANKGRLDFASNWHGRVRGGMWVSEIHSGNNDIWWAADGTWHYLGRGQTQGFSNTVLLQAVEIL